MRTGYGRVGASPAIDVGDAETENGDIEVIEPAAATDDFHVLSDRSAATEAQAKAEAERELKAAHQEAARVRTQARNRAAEMKTEALRERIEYRAAAERQIGKLLEQAKHDADEIRAGATSEVERIKAEAEGEAAAIIENAEVAVTAMVEDAHRLAAQIVDSAQLEADRVIAEAGNRIELLDDTAREIVASVAQMKERFQTSEPQPAVLEGTGDVIAVHEEEVVEPIEAWTPGDEPEAELIAFSVERPERPRRRWFHVFRRV